MTRQRIKGREVVLEEVEGVWVVTVPDLPGCVTQGRTKAEAMRNAREAIECHVQAFGPC